MSTIFTAAYFESLLKFMLALFSIINPMGAVSIFVALTSDKTHREVKKISTITALTVWITLLVAFFIGNAFLTLFGITIASFQIGGGVLLSVMALNMMGAKNHASKINSQEKEQLNANDPIAVVPLAIPMLAGPGSISTSIVYSTEFSSPIDWVFIVLIYTLLAVLIKLILMSSEFLGRKLGTLGINVLTRIMGLITMALAVEFISKGIKTIFPSLG